MKRFLSIKHKFENRQKPNYLILNSEKSPYNESFALLFYVTLDEFPFSLFVVYVPKKKIAAGKQLV